MLNDSTGMPLRRAHIVLTSAGGRPISPQAPKPTMRATSCCAIFPKAQYGFRRRATDFLASARL